MPDLPNHTHGQGGRYVASGGRVATRFESHVGGLANTVAYKAFSQSLKSSNLHTGLIPSRLMVSAVSGNQVEAQVHRGSSLENHAIKVSVARDALNKPSNTFYLATGHMVHDMAVNRITPQYREPNFDEVSFKEALSKASVKLRPDVSMKNMMASRIAAYIKYPAQFETSPDPLNKLVKNLVTGAFFRKSISVEESVDKQDHSV